MPADISRLGYAPEGERLRLMFLDELSCSCHVGGLVFCSPDPGRTTAHILRCDPLSATVVHVKSPDEGGVDESLPSQIRGLLSARNAQMPERRTAAF